MCRELRGFWRQAFLPCLGTPPVAKHKDARGVSCPALTERRSQDAWLLVCINREFKSFIMLAIRDEKSYAEQEEYVMTGAEAEYSGLWFLSKARGF